MFKYLYKLFFGNNLISFSEIKSISTNDKSTNTENNFIETKNISIKYCLENYDIKCKCEIESDCECNSKNMLEQPFIKTNLIKINTDLIENKFDFIETENKSTSTEITENTKNKQNLILNATTSNIVNHYKSLYSDYCSIGLQECQSLEHTHNMSDNFSRLYRPYFKCDQTGWCSCWESTCGWCSFKNHDYFKLSNNIINNHTINEIERIFNLIE